MRYARLRFATAVAPTAAGVLLGAGAFCFGPSTESWIGLGAGSTVLVITLLAFLTAGRGAVQRILDVLLMPVSIWTLISARTIELAGHGASPALVKWLGFSAGAAIFAIGVIALLAHELGLEADLRWAMAELTGSETEPAAEQEPEPAPEHTGNGHVNGNGARARPTWVVPARDEHSDWRPRRRT